MEYFDMHCHLDFASNAQEAAAELDALGLGAFAVGVLPNARPGGGGESGTLVPFPTGAVKWGVGLHPWWIASGRAGENELETLLGAIETNRFVGEVGLDFGKTHGAQPEAQVQAFTRIAKQCAQVGGRTLSIHAVRAASTALDILQTAGTLENCTCIFHWFSDSSEALAQAVAAKCYFSVGKLMLQSKRGREYARQIPLEYLLLETDEPAQGMPYQIGMLQKQLQATCETIAQLRKTDATSLATQIAKTSRFLLEN